jgi:group I intron endonuclease
VEQQEIYGIIYKVTNKINEKMYIGRTTNLKEKMRIHMKRALNNKHNSHFHNAIRKYSKENFKWKIIAKCFSKEELNNVEIEMIEKYNTFENGYNLTRGGEGRFGYSHTEETKKKISEAERGEKNHMYGKRGSNCPNFGKTHSKKTKKRMSEAKKGENHTFYSKHCSKKTKEKMSLAQIGGKNHNAKKYVITTPEGKEIFVHGIANFCRNYKKEELYYQGLVRVAKGKRSHHKGYKCEYFVE